MPGGRLWRGRNVTDEILVHPQGICESDQVGPRTRVWAFAHVMKGARIGADCNICQGVFVESGAWVGDRVTVKNGVFIWDGVRVEDDVFLSPACVLTNVHRPRSRQGARASGRTAFDQTLIKQGATIGAGAVLVCPVTVGCFAFVGAGAVVTADVPDQALVVGNPARHVGWVCVCGQELDGDLVCPDCARRYLVGEEGGLTGR